MTQLIVSGRLQLVSDLMGPLAFNGWAMLCNSVTGARSDRVAVPGWRRVVDDRRIYDSTLLTFGPLAAAMTYDAWGLALDGGAEPFLLCPMDNPVSAQRGQRIEIEARITRYELASPA